MANVIIMKKCIMGVCVKTVRFLVHPDCTFQQIEDSGLSGFFPDFADTFLRYCAKGYKVTS